jgi:hypothetical protein
MALVHRVGWDPRLCERSPWLWPLTAAASHFERHADWPTLADFDRAYRAITTGLGVPELSFRANVRKQDKHDGARVVLHALYDARIALTREVPTRERDWHDLLNMLCFSTFPHSKLALHARQYARLAERLGEHATKLPNRRTPEQDALTLFDEGGVLLACDAEAHAQLSAAARPGAETLALSLCSARRLRVVPFGHALFEHEIEGLRCPGGASLVMAVPQLWADTPTLLRGLDRALSSHLQDPMQFLSPRAYGQIRLATFAL